MATHGFWDVNFHGKWLAAWLFAKYGLDSQTLVYLLDDVKFLGCKEWNKLIAQLTPSVCFANPLYRNKILTCTDELALPPSNGTRTTHPRKPLHFGCCSLDSSSVFLQTCTTPSLLTQSSSSTSTTTSSFLFFHLLL
jgi:hypothetical protein